MHPSGTETAPSPPKDDKLAAKPWLRRHAKKLIALCVFAVLALIACGELLCSKAAEGRIYKQSAQIPHAQAALVLGCSPEVYARPNLYFQYRIKAASDLYHQGKVDYLIVSGDNSRKDYDESTAMAEALIKNGVPEERIFCDYAGFSTLDSVLRLKQVFKLQSATIISQEFHLQRALCIADWHGLDCYGYSAKDLNNSGWTLRSMLRERLARVAMLADLLLQREARFGASAADSQIQHYRTGNPQQPQSGAQ